VLVLKYVVEAVLGLSVIQSGQEKANFSLDRLAPKFPARNISPPVNSAHTLFLVQTKFYKHS
jgi:hypothetical protein